MTNRRDPYETHKHAGIQKDTRRRTQMSSDELPPANMHKKVGKEKRKHYAARRCRFISARAPRCSTSVMRVLPISLNLLTRVSV